MTEAVLGLHPAQAGDGQRIVALVLAAIVPEGMAHIDAAMGIGQAGDDEIFVGKASRVAGLAGQPSIAGGAAQHHGRAAGPPAVIGTDDLLLGAPPRPYWSQD